MKVKIAELRISKFSENIYCHTPPPDLIKSIKENGLLLPIWIDKDNNIISGHRRVNACNTLGLQEIECEVREYSDLLVVEANRYRDKTWKERLKEAEVLEKILSEGAFERKRAGKINDSDLVQNSAQGKTRIQVAKSIGISHDTLYKVKEISKGSPELFKQLDSGKKTVNSAYTILQREQKLKQFHEKKVSLPEGKFNIIYADPPWQYEHSISESRDIENQYPTMTLEDICNFPISSIVSDNAILFLWATNPKLQEAMKVIQSWGFSYRTNMVWIKNKIGMGYYVRSKHELLLISKRGDFSPPIEANRPDSVINAPRSQHSQKPQIVYEFIERMYPNCRYIELFSRNKREGWTMWGNES